MKNILKEGFERVAHDPDMLELAEWDMATMNNL